MTGLSSAIVRGGEALTELGPAWAHLWRRCPCATPFQHPAWLLPWWDTFHPGELHGVAIHEGRELAGFAPLYLEDGAYGRRLLPLGIGLSDYLDVMIDPAHAAEAGRLIAEACKAVPTHWEELAPGAAACLLPVPAGCRESVAPQNCCPVLDLAPGGDLAAVLPAGKLRKLRMARHRAARRAMRIEAVTGCDTDIALNHLVRLHAERWNSRGEPGVLADAEVRRFHAVALPGLKGAGLLHMFTLKLDEAVAGVYYGLVAGDQAYAYLSGFDPAFAFESPGTLLIGHAIESAMREGVTAFHFLRGQEAYKYEWGAKDRWTRRRVMEPWP